MAGLAATKYQKRRDHEVAKLVTPIQAALLHNSPLAYGRPLMMAIHSFLEKPTAENMVKVVTKLSSYYENETFQRQRIRAGQSPTDDPASLSESHHDPKGCIR